MKRRSILSAVPAVVLAGALGAASAHAAEPLKAAFFGVKLIDTSLGTVTPEEEARVVMIADRLVEKLAGSGRYEFLDTAPVADKADNYTNLAHCNGCDADLAEELGADVAITGEVQKTSNLILHISVYIRDVATERLVGGGSADIRSNTDESWRRGIDYVVENRILRE